MCAHFHLFSFCKMQLSCLSQVRIFASSAAAWILLRDSESDRAQGPASKCGISAHWIFKTDDWWSSNSYEFFLIYTPIEEINKIWYTHTYIHKLIHILTILSSVEKKKKCLFLTHCKIRCWYHHNKWPVNKRKAWRTYFIKSYMTRMPSGMQHQCPGKKWIVIEGCD